MADFMNNAFGGFDEAIARFYNLLATGAGDFFTPLANIITFLGEKGIHIARRTVAKYREELGILSSSKRKVY